MEESEKIPTLKWYRIEYIDGYTAKLWEIELTGRRVGKKVLIKEDLPSIIQGHWAKLVLTQKEM